MVKNLVPPSCSTNHFVRQYAKLLHTIDDNENYEERRTKLLIPKSTICSVLHDYVFSIYFVPDEFVAHVSHYYL